MLLINYNLSYKEPQEQARNCLLVKSSVKMENKLCELIKKTTIVALETVSSSLCFRCISCTTVCLIIILAHSYPEACYPYLRNEIRVVYPFKISFPLHTVKGSNNQAFSSFFLFCTSQAPWQSLDNS